MPGWWSISERGRSSNSGRRTQWEPGGGAGAVEHQRARPQQQQRPPHSMGAGVGAEAKDTQQQRPPHSMGAGVGAEAKDTQQQRQLPQHELEPWVVTEGAAAATSVMNRWIPKAERPTGDGTMPGRGFGAGTVAAAFTRGQQEHLVVPSSSPGPLQQQRYRVTPVVTRSRAQPPGVSKSWSQPFYIFPRQPCCRRANSDHAPWYSITRIWLRLPILRVVG